MKQSEIITGPHTNSRQSISSIMLTVIVALLPATLLGLFIYGWPAVNLFIITLLSCLLMEAICLALARRPIKPALMDGSALLTGWLLAMTLPPWAPWWIAVLGAFFAIVIGKQIFGGLGQNIFNPAMLARVGLLVAFPVQMTTWVSPVFQQVGGAPDFIAGLAITFSDAVLPDALTGATTLSLIKTEFSRGLQLPGMLEGHYSQLDSAIGIMRGSSGETSALLILLGGLWLLYKRIITWHIPVSVLGSVALIALLFNAMDPAHYPDPLLHLFSGGLILGAFFIATDMVTSPSSKLGQIIYGIGCGAFIFIIRSWGGFPEGVAFAVLLMNAATPLIDHYTRPRIYGRSRNGRAITIPEEVGKSS